MANTHFSGPVNSENGYKWNKIGQTEYSYEYDSDDLVLYAGANEALRIDADGKVQITSLETDLVVESGLIKQEDGDGSVELTGADAADLGGNFKAWGDSHATRASDFAVRSGSTEVISFDSSAGRLTLNENDIRLASTAADTVAITMQQSDATLAISADSTITTGANILMYGSTHDTNANDFIVRSATTSVLSYDASASLLSVVGDITMTNSLVVENENNALGSITLGQVDGGGARVLTGRENGNIQIFSSSDATGSYYGIYGPSHASLANDVQINNGSSNVLYWDDSANTITFGADSASQVAMNGNNLQYNSSGAVTHDYSITSGASDGTIEITSGTGVASGANIKLWGDTHAGAPNDWAIRAGSTRVVDYIHASQLVCLRAGGTARFCVDSTGIGFFNVAPVAQAAAYTPTNVTTDRSYDANATTLDEVADVLGTLIADLQAYGLLQ